MQNLRIIHPSKSWWSDLHLNSWAGTRIMCFWFGAAAQPSQCPVLCTAASTCPAPAVAQWAWLTCDLNMLRGMEMGNKVKISLHVWILGFLWKHLFCRNSCVLFAGCGRARCSLWCHTLHFVLAVLHMRVEGSTCHFPREELRGFFFVYLQLCLSATDHIYSAPTSPCSFLF